MKKISISRKASEGHKNRFITKLSSPRRGDHQNSTREEELNIRNNMRREATLQQERRGPASHHQSST
jgi:hypothetical protein